MIKKAESPKIVLPSWTQVTDERRAHIERVVALLNRWASSMKLPGDEVSRWTAAGTLHDALRDAPETMLRALTGEGSRPVALLHGPAAAVRAEQDGERRQEVLEAVRYHTIGFPEWKRTGQALYMADFLEPGRDFMVKKRAALAEKVPRDFERAFQESVRLRLEWALHEGGKLFPETVALWNAAL